MTQAEENAPDSATDRSNVELGEEKEEEIEKEEEVEKEEEKETEKGAEKETEKGTEKGTEKETEKEKREETKTEEEKESTARLSLTELLAKIAEPTDFTICCAGREYKVHSKVLTIRSRYFERVLKGKFLESQTRKIELVDEDPEAAELLISFIYGVISAYHWNPRQTLKWDPTRLTFAGLKEIPKSRSYKWNFVYDMLDRVWDTPPLPGLKILHQYALIDKFDLFFLRKWAIMQVIYWFAISPCNDKLVDMLREIYEGTTGNYTILRDNVLWVLKKKVHLWMDNDRFFEFLREDADLLAELFKWVVKRERTVEKAIEVEVLAEELEIIWGTDSITFAVEKKLHLHGEMREKWLARDVKSAKGSDV
ncbi:hypothetical protein AJ80_06454 [Polytolypa hystricis UAMH7299]|uniref:BTB domain-containing protein n=1 Tax=Polytolypa hystricis (strain UAMH7299) TaxID=1447883 RepID=A0A2B7XWS8_POLH7|nr:hypothetical protein AJ80_06454 [Polytolypa hystricis UAMH7299]